MTDYKTTPHIWIADRKTHEPEWLEDGVWSPYCKDCVDYRNNGCANFESDHHGHMLMGAHFACTFFEER